MKHLIIYAHPDTGGHCEHILSEVKERLDDFEVIDLYKENYDPVLHENEHYTRGNYEISERNKEFQEKIKESKYLIFIFPVWWYAPPAVLKGFLDRVFISRFAFRYVNGIPKGLLKDKKATVFFTTGAPTIYYKLFGNLPKKNMAKTLGFSGIKSRVYQFGRCLKFNEKKKASITKKIRKISF
ncbi:MAG: NAD(P)H-dependent oxidoreductase [Nanobdellota archaeon]